MNIDLPLRPAPHGLRVGASVIDALVMASVLTVTSFSIMLVVSFFATYHFTLTWLTQQTVGKALFGLEVRRIDKEPGFLWALGRSTVGYLGVDMLGFGLLFALFDRRHRALHDVVFSSEVVTKEGGTFNGKILLTRLILFAERQKAALEEKRRAITPLIKLWGFLAALAGFLKKGIDLLGGFGRPEAESVQGQSLAATVSAKAAVAVAAVTTSVTTFVAAQAPGVSTGIEWAFTPRHWRPGSWGTVALEVDPCMLYSWQDLQEFLSRLGPKDPGTEDPRFHSSPEDPRRDRASGQVCRYFGTDGAYTEVVVLSNDSSIHQIPSGADPIEGVGDWAFLLEDTENSGVGSFGDARAVLYFLVRRLLLSVETGIDADRDTRRNALINLGRVVASRARRL